MVGIIVGSDSDLPIIKPAAEVLDELGISYEITIGSAHRTPEYVSEYASSAMERGIKVIIAAAGGSAHLPGVVASKTTLPVIGVPVDNSPLKGVDSLYSMVQMPRGVPVATMAIGSAGAYNAGIFAAQILSLTDEKIAQRLAEFRRRNTESVMKKSEKLREIGLENYMKTLRDC